MLLTLSKPQQACKCATNVQFYFLRNSPEFPLDAIIPVLNVDIFSLFWVTTNGIWIGE
jgi:hypothetical protein